MLWLIFAKFATRTSQKQETIDPLADYKLTSMSDRPRFTWTPLADAGRYSVDGRDLATDAEAES
jgi:hypothetical protein